MTSFHDLIGQDRPIRILQSILRTQSVPNALLFTGDEGVGKKSAARLFIQTLLCKEVIKMPSGEGKEAFLNPCQSCLSCKKMRNQNHPDLFVVTPEPDETSIKIDQIRLLQEQIVFPPIEAARKIFLIDMAPIVTSPKQDNLQNSLLKTIEEPPPYALLILISAQPARLAPTLVSRCQTIPFSPLSLSQIESILMEKKEWTAAEARLVAALTGGRLGEALSLEPLSACKMEEEYHRLVEEETLAHYDTLFEMAKTYSADAETFERALYYLSAYFRDVLILLAVSGGEIDSSYLVFSWRQEELLRWSTRMNPREVAKCLADITVTQHSLIRNINKTVALETLLMQMRDKLSENEKQ
jgi:DNA polymerase-3 subunit delta'